MFNRREAGCSVIDARTSSSPKLVETVMGVNSTAAVGVIDA
jgi:hypothetical protein